MQGIKAVVYLGPDRKALQERPQPIIGAATDAIVRITRTTICVSSRAMSPVVSLAAFRVTRAMPAGLKGNPSASAVFSLLTLGFVVLAIWVIGLFCRAGDAGPNRYGDPVPRKPR
jgi:hypothetical protein